MEIYKNYKFHASRYLINVPKGHICSKMHGHTFTLTIVIDGPINKETDFVMDFYDIDAIYKKHIHNALDHQILNDVEGLESPTTENLCIWVFQRLKGAFPNSVDLVSISINEGEDYGCSYYGE